MDNVKGQTKQAVPVEFELKESGELSSQDMDAIAEFIARLAYNNLKNAQKSADDLIRSALMKENDNDKRTDQS
jgi:hypothetical protein